MSIPLNKFELHNLVVENDQVKVRQAFTEHTSVSAVVGTGSKFIYGFSVKATNTDEIFHYLFTRTTATGQSYVHVTTEQFRLITTFALGVLPPNPAIYYAVRYQQLIINSPHMSNAVYGLVGGGLKSAEKVDSVNINTSVIDIPNGIVCRFGDRMVIAQGNILFFSDAGTEPRTFAAINGVSVDSQIYAMFEGPNGALTVCAGNGVHVLPVDSLGSTQKVVGFFSKVSDFTFSNYRSAVFSSNAIVALDKTGVSFIGNETAHMDLTSFRQRRYFSKPVGFGNSGDNRNGTIWPTTKGVALSLNGQICYLDMDTGTPSWFYNSADMTIVGMCKTRDGNDLFVTPDRVVELFGNTEFDGVEIKGIACGRVPSEPEQAPIVRFITTSADNVGLRQFAYLDDSPRTKTTPANSRDANIVETSIWTKTANVYSSREMRSRRHEFSVRTDDINLEVGAEGACTNLGPITIETGGKGPMRPTN